LRPKGSCWITLPACHVALTFTPVFFLPHKA
jgi:hypothetical protein